MIKNKTVYSRTFIVRCKFCGNNQKVISYKQSPLGVMKKCVFCERRFCIHRSPQNSKIIKEVFHETGQRTL